MNNIEKHGGQDINLNIKLIDDYSVTTNYLGISEIGLLNIKNNIDSITHYPNQSQEPFRTNLINWLYKDNPLNNNNLILGNGASELLDLLIRSIRYDKNMSIYQSKSWKPGSSTVQYVEYERSCNNCNYEKKDYMEINTDVTCIINPCNPTGEYKNINELKNYISSYCRPNSIVIVDESMQLWVGENFRSDSLLSQTEWINNMYAESKIAIFIIHSWTKFFCCTGIRIGSIICPNDLYCNLLLKYMTPWSCNILALKYLDGCINDNDYMCKTWNTTTAIRENMVNIINSMYPSWTIYGEKFLSWIWIDTHSAEFAKLIYEMCKFNGVPIRLGVNGYKLPSFIRIGVRSDESNQFLFKILNELKIFNYYKYPHIKIPNDLIVKHDLIDIDDILCHENIIEERSDALYKYIETLENTRIIPSIILDYHTNTLIDGHHRLSVLKKLNYKKIYCLFINYSHPSIIVNPNNKLTTTDVINAATTANYLLPKSTQHMITDLDNNIHPIVVLSNLVHY
jgi:histidinol-phosphate/aromatic aminotransferase/cobyric acid decarboxylase-like protein